MRAKAQELKDKKRVKQLAKTEKIEKPEMTINEQIKQIKNEIVQIEQEYWKRIGKLEVLNKLHDADKV